ncbi:MAG: anti-anti-sigma factor [Acidobacteria bacterium 37-65-4]|nr:MAG: anti-anti-sigma factor [Acidobacteria bacterium 37-65-4]
MNHRTYEKDGVSVLELKGTITLGAGDVTMRDVIKDLLGKEKKSIVVDLGEVSFMDSTGLGELVAAYTTARHQGATLKLANLTKKTKDLLSITQLAAVFESYDSLGEAIGSFR